jgi:ketosteroid isomerase-like protein
MSQDHIEIVRRFYDAWSNHEFPGPVDHMDPDIEYVNPPGAIEPGTRHGRESALWTLRDGKVVRYEWFHEPTDAFRAVGVEE